MPIYNKLVRDRIPEIIQDAGKHAKSRILSDAEYQHELRRKLEEELGEYLQAKSDREAQKELADILECIKALASLHGSSLQEIEKLRKKKAEERGGFAEKVFLIEVVDGED